MEEQYQFIEGQDHHWSAMEVKTLKNPKKKYQIKGVLGLIDLNSKESVSILECWFWPAEFDDKRAMFAIMQIQKAKEICLYGRKSKIFYEMEVKLVANLTKLRVNQFCLTEVPLFILKQTNLIHLDLSKNQLVSLPNELGQLTSLKELHFFQNKLNLFPMVILKLPNIERLSINFNCIPSIPEDIGSMKNLKDLGINYNPDLKELPKVFWTGLKSLKILAIVGTKFNDNPNNKIKIGDLKKRGITLV